jgi:hypothetical protein
MKKRAFFAILAVVLSPFFLFACDSWLGVNITDEAQLKKMQLKIAQFVKPDLFVHEIRMTSADERAKDIMGKLVITYTDTFASNHLKEMTIDICEWKLIEEREIKAVDPETFEREREGSGKVFVSITDCDLTMVASICRQAMKQVEAQDMKYAGIEYFSTSYREAEPTYEFMMNGRPNGSGVTSKGRYSAIYYYEVLFQTGQDGNLDMSVGKELKVKRGDLI